MNSNPTLHVKVNGFSDEQSKVCELLIRTTPESVSYAIIDKQENIVKALTHVKTNTPAETLSRLISQDDYLNFTFQKVKISSETFNFAFIPAEIYTDAALPVVSNFVTASAEVKPMTNSIAQGAIKAVFTLNGQTADSLLSLFPSASLYSQAEPFISGGLAMPAERPTLFFQFNTGTFEVLLVSGKKLAFYNIFSAVSLEDITYFTLLVIKELNLSADETDVVLCGEIEKYTATHKRVCRYFKNTSFADSNTIYRYPDTFGQVHAHSFFSLLSLGLCE